MDTYPLRKMNGLNLIEVSQCSLCNWLFSLFSRHISRTQSFQQNRHVIFPALVALNLLVSLISRLVACSARIVADKQTDRQTDTQNDYCNPRCACAPRVNNRYFTETTVSSHHVCYNTKILLLLLIRNHSTIIPAVCLYIKEERKQTI